MDADKAEWETPDWNPGYFFSDTHWEYYVSAEVEAMWPVLPGVVQKLIFVLASCLAELAQSKYDE